MEVIDTSTPLKLFQLAELPLGKYSTFLKIVDDLDPVDS